MPEQTHDREALARRMLLDVADQLDRNRLPRSAANVREALALLPSPPAPTPGDTCAGYPSPNGPGCVRCGEDAHAARALAARDADQGALARVRALCDEWAAHPGSIRAFCADDLRTALALASEPGTEEGARHG